MPRIDIGGVSIRLTGKGDSWLMLCDGLYVDGSTHVETLIKASGIEGSWDGALPEQWVKAEYLDKGRQFPRGVWLYEKGSIFGRFLSIEEMVKKVRVILVRRKVIAKHLLVRNHLIDEDLAGRILSSMFERYVMSDEDIGSVMSWVIHEFYDTNEETGKYEFWSDVERLFMEILEVSDTL